MFSFLFFFFTNPGSNDDKYGLLLSLCSRGKLKPYQIRNCSSKDPAGLSIMFHYCPLGICMSEYAELIWILFWRLSYNYSISPFSFFPIHPLIYSWALFQIHDLSSIITYIHIIFYYFGFFFFFESEFLCILSWN